MNSDICIIVPVRNDANCIEPFVKAVDQVLRPHYAIHFVCDPGTDPTSSVINALAAAYPVSVFFTTERLGQEACTILGLEQKKEAGLLGIMDVDLQDPPSLLPAMIRELENGYDLVWPYKSKTSGRNLAYRFLAWLWYLCLSFKRVPIPRGAGNFSVMTSGVAKTIVDSRIPFVRKAIAGVSCRRKMIPYERPWRVTGESKYNRYWGSLKIAFMGLFK